MTPLFLPDDPADWDAGSVRALKREPLGSHSSAWSILNVSRVSSLNLTCKNVIAIIYKHHSLYNISFLKNILRR